MKIHDNTIVPALGQGSARLGQGRHPEAAEEEALRTGLSLGMTLIDTAEIYGNGNAERLISHVIAGQRDRVLLVSKVWPNHVVGNGIERACDASLARLGTDQQHNRGRELLPVRRTLFYIDVLEFRRSVRAYCERPGSLPPRLKGAPGRGTGGLPRKSGSAGQNLRPRAGGVSMQGCGDVVTLCGRS